MPYCVNCGAQNPEGARFCVSCGKPVTEVTQAASAKPEASGQAASPTKAIGTANLLLLAAMGLYAVAALLLLMSGSFIGLVVLPLIMAVLIYLTAYAPLQKVQNKAAQNGAAIAGGLSLLFGFIDIALGDMAAAIFAFVIAAVLGLAWNQVNA